MKILSLSQIRSAEIRAVNESNITFSDLMLKAGQGAVKIVCDQCDVLSKKVTVVCGKGNNGGDGMIVASELKHMGADVAVCCPLGEPETDAFKPLATRCSDIKRTNEIGDCDILIDALFGIGLDRNISGESAQIIEKMNLATAFKIALDLPSGVFADGGRSKVCFKSDITITFIALKTCFMLPETSSFCGKVFLCDLGIEPSEHTYLTVPPLKMPARDINSHKGTFGTALLICGSYGMCGAEILSASAALRTGAGIVKAIVCDKNYSAFTASIPEAVTVPVPTDDYGAPVVYDKTLLSSLSSSTAVLIGSGLSRTAEANKLVLRALSLSEIPIVLDADGINAIAGDINIIKRVKSSLIITPHPAEMARLLDTTVSDIETNRIRYSRDFSVTYGCVTVLKGAHTIVAMPDGRVYFNMSGNAGLATAGSGDVLSGIIVSLLAQGCTAERAALTAVNLHGKAGDMAAEKYGQISLCAGDVIKELPELLK